MTLPLERVCHEASKAEQRYGPFTSTHEALGVLVEEMAELTDAIRANGLGAIQSEAVQVAAVALRLAAHCQDGTAFAERSTK